MSASFTLQTRILDQSLTLSLKGLILDTISLVGPVFTADLLKNASKLAEAVRWCVRHGRNECMPGDATYMRDLAICLTCGSNKFNTDAELDQEHKQAFKLFLRDYRQPSTTIRCNMPGKPNRCLTRASSQDPPVYWHHLWSKALNRRFFVTATGTMGMGPLATKAEDLICALFGSEAPFILRPLGHYYELIGDAYARARGTPCNGKTWSDAAGQDNLAPIFAQMCNAERWFDIL